MRTSGGRPVPGASAVGSGAERRAPPGSEPTVAVVGVGGLGLATACTLDAAGADVVGYDADPSTVETLRRGGDPTGPLGPSRVRDADCAFTSDPSALGRTDYVLLAVPVPLGDDGRSDLSPVRTAGRAVGEQLSPGTTVALQSTVPPGTTEGVLLPQLVAASGLCAGEQFHVGYAAGPPSSGRPEADPEPPVRLVAARTPAGADAIAGLFEATLGPVHRIADVATAEAATCAASLHREVALALANELSATYEASDLDARAALDAAAAAWNVPQTRPGLPDEDRHAVDHLPVGTDAARAARTAREPGLVRTARCVTDRVPDRVVAATVDGLRTAGRPLPGDGGATDPPWVLVAGLGDGSRASDAHVDRSGRVVDGLRERGVEVVGHAPRADDDGVRERYGVPVQSDPRVDAYDGLVVLEDHEAYRALTLAGVRARLRNPSVVVDLPGVFDRLDGMDGLVYERP